MKKTWLKIGGVIIAMAVTATVQAVPVSITGTISMSGSASFDTSSVNTATKVSVWGNPNAVTVGTDSGAFGSILTGTVVNMTPNWVFNPSTPLTPLWSVGGFTFSIISDTIVQQGGVFLTISGIGTIVPANATKYLPTTYAWSFSSQDPIVGQPATGTFSAAVLGVPDGGTTVMLLGIALSGVALLKRKLTA